MDNGDKLVKSSKTKCPSCGDTKISLNTETGKLRCHSCRHEFESEKFEKIVDDVASLERVVVGQGAQNIAADAQDVLTLKCDSCQAEVVVDTSEALQARCHWCRSVLSVNQQILNGVVPDKVLPFSVTKEEAQAEIAKLVDKRSFFAHPKFKKEFTSENVMGVYLPYMVVDVNASTHFSGQGETIFGVSNSANLYDIERHFDLFIENLTIESSAEMLHHQHYDYHSANNIVKAIKPFDTENSVKWDANYLCGFTSLKRDTNIDDLVRPMEVKIKDVARSQIRSTLKIYDRRGVRWDVEEINIKGTQWKTVYLPIWLYTCQIKGFVHYVAVNGRTLKTMGSVPINWTLFWLFTLIIIAITTVGIWLLMIGGGPMVISDENGGIGLVILALAFALFSVGPIFYINILSKYRNQGARFDHESEVNARIDNIRKQDGFITTVYASGSKISGRNDSKVDYK